MSMHGCILWMVLSIKFWLVPLIERLGMASESETHFHYIMFVNT